MNEKNNVNKITNSLEFVFLSKSLTIKYHLVNRTVFLYIKSIIMTILHTLVEKIAIKIVFTHWK